MRFEAIVVGGGIVGLSAAWGLVEGGLNQVLLVERRLLASGATGLGTGSVHTQRWHPTDSALILRSKRLMGEITERSSGTFQLFPVGRLTLAGRADTATVRGYGRHLRAIGVGAVELSPDEVAEGFPGLNVSDVAIGLHTQDDGIIYPSALIWALAGLYRNGGGTIWEGCEVKRIVHSEGAARGVELANGDIILCDRLILTAGIWTKRLLEASGLNLAMKHVVAHNTVVTVGRTDLWAHVPSLLDGIQGVIAIPRNPGTIMASNAFAEYEACKETAEGVLKASSVEVRRAEIAFVERQRTQQLQILAQLRYRYRDHDIRGAVGHWAGLLDGTPDSHPYVGPYPGLDGLWVGCGLTGYGVQRGPGVGEVLANSALHQPLPVDVDSYRLDRFDAGVDFQIDLSRDNPLAGFSPSKDTAAAPNER